MNNMGSFQHKIEDIFNQQTPFKPQYHNNPLELKEHFENFWLTKANLDVFNSNQVEEEWEILVDSLKKYGIYLPKPFHYYGSGLHYILNSLYSAKYGRPIGFNFSKLIQVLHHIELFSKSNLRILGWALKVYKRDKQIIEEDKTGKWAKKVENFKHLMRDGDKAYEHNHKYDRLVIFLFPEFKDIMKKL